jgi:hypothetical protein
VELVEDGALKRLDQITRQYTHHPHYYGYVYQVEQQAQETRVICRIHAVNITLDAIRNGSADRPSPRKPTGRNVANFST